MKNGNPKMWRLKISLAVFHTLFAAMILLELPWLIERSNDQFGLLLLETSALYLFYILPFALWHAGDGLQRNSFSGNILAAVLSYRFALLCFVAKMLWGLAYALDFVDVPGAHEFGTLNAYGVFVSAALFALATSVGTAKLLVGTFSCLKGRSGKVRSER